MEKPIRSDHKYWVSPSDFLEIKYIRDLDDYADYLFGQNMKLKRDNSELLKQNKELREALDNLVKAVPNDGTWNHQAAWDKAYRILNTPTT